MRGGRSAGPPLYCRLTLYLGERAINRLALAIGICGSFPGSRGGLLLAVFLAFLAAVTLAAILDGTEVAEHGFILPSPRKQKWPERNSCEFLSGHSGKSEPISARYAIPGRFPTSTTKPVLHIPLFVTGCQVLNFPRSSVTAFCIAPPGPTLTRTDPMNRSPFRISPTRTRSSQERTENVRLLITSLCSLISVALGGGSRRGTMTPLPRVSRRPSSSVAGPPARLAAVRPSTNSRSAWCLAPRP